MRHNIRSARELRPLFGGESLPQPQSAPPLASFEIMPTTYEQKLNKTEARWLEILRGRSLTKLRIQAFTLKLAYRDTYTPDFSAIDERGRMVLWEVKGGFIREDAWQKLKFAAREYVEFEFVMAQFDKGEWTETPIKP